MEKEMACTTARGASAQLLWEFLRYAVVGGIAFIADFLALVAAQELYFRRFALGLYISVSIGFLVGLVVNYALSLAFVFTRPEDRGKGRTFWAFLVFGAIGLAGLGLTELGMWLGAEVMAWNYMAVKVVVTAAVLAWNYLGRRMLIFNRKGDAQ